MCAVVAAIWIGSVEVGVTTLANLTGALHSPAAQWSLVTLRAELVASPVTPRARRFSQRARVHLFRLGSGAIVAFFDLQRGELVALRGTDDALLKVALVIFITRLTLADSIHVIECFTCV